VAKKAKKAKTAKKAKKARKAKKAVAKRAVGAYGGNRHLMSAVAAVAHAAQTGKKYFRSMPEGTWIECDWDPDQQVSDNCHPVPASQVPKSWGGDGPG
jgi:hypothetical protein